jgi:hypothetical protein
MKFELLDVELQYNAVPVSATDAVYAVYAGAALFV